MKKIISSVLIAGSFVLTSGVQAASIDDFDGATFDNVVADATDTFAYAGAIGGFRTIGITKSGPLGATASVILPTGVYAHSSDSLTSAVSTITWDSKGAGLGGVDLTDGRDFSVFSFEIISIDQGNVDLSFLVKDTDNNSASYKLSGAMAGLQAIAFDKFVGIDFTSVDFISLTIEGDAGSDLVLDNLKTVPTPATMILMLVGLAGFFFTRKQQDSVLMA